MDIFKTLAAGAKFQKDKTKPLADLFRGSSSTTSSSSQEDDDLNFFRAPKPKEDSNGVKQEKAKKRPREEPNEPSDENTNNFDREDELNAFRNRLKIKVKGEAVPNPCPTFHEMNISKSIKSVLLHNIEESRWKEPTPIQMQAIPALIQGRDILASAPTGSGKTASYLIPVLSRLNERTSSNKNGIRVLLLAPTKELADQIFRELLRLTTGFSKNFKICNLKKNIMNRAINDEGKSTFNKFQILVATPLRLVSLIRANAIDLTSVESIVMDEADKLLELDRSKPSKANDDDDEDDNEEEEGQKRERSSFLQQVDEILAQCPSPSNLQRALFSATIGPFVRELASAFLINPIEVSIGIENSGASTINQKLVFVGREDGKVLAIRQLIQQGIKPPVLIFVQSMERAKDLFKELIFDGINVDFMHSGRSAYQREEIIRRFRIGEIWVLICTDLMARGIDFKGVQMVINYDLPLTPVSYIHRIGRTGRAGKQGEAITYFTEQDIPRLRPIANVVKLSGCDVPDWMLAIKQLSTKNKRKLRNHAPMRRKITKKVFEEKGESNDNDDDDGDNREKKRSNKKRRKT